MKILIVDDEQIAIEGILANIEFSQYGISQVATANNMEQAKEVIRQGGIQIVMCDIEMPNGSGLELIAWINAWDSKIVTLILSCHTEFQFAQAAVGLSCQQYLTKPATPEELDKAITSAVSEVLKRSSDQNIRKFGEEYMKRLAGGSEDEVGAVEQVHAYIIDHIEEELSVEELARRVYLSQNHLARIFKKKYGKTIVEYITQYRLGLAEELLKNTNLTVTTVSAKIGYPNYAYFTKLFKKYTGYTPSAYRNKYMGEKG